MPTTAYKIMRVVSHDVESRAQLNAVSLFSKSLVDRVDF